MHQKYYRTAIQTDTPYQNSLSIQTDASKKSIKVLKNNQATETDYDYNMQELNENDRDFMHRRLKDYFIKNPEVNESLNQSENPLTPKVVSPNLAQKTPKSESPVVVNIDSE